MTVISSPRRASWREWFQRSPADELIRKAGDISVHVIAGTVKESSADRGVKTSTPSATFQLRAYALATVHVAVALATDVNPGGGFSPAMPFAMTLACFGMGLTFEEALVASTINAACSIDRQNEIGSLEPGKQMDAVVVNGPAIDLIRVGVETIRHVIKKGRLLPC